MKKIVFFLIVAAGFAACENQDQDFDDYHTQTVYFPRQYPARTLILGESESDNTIDLQHAFSIGVSVGGTYSNPSERLVDIELDETLVDDITFASGADVKVLPTEYYESMNFDQIRIPSGSFNGTIRVNLTDEFFEDPLSTGLSYVIPLRISETTSENVLPGIVDPKFEGVPDVRNVSHWSAGHTPKNFMLFAIKYINQYHGTYLHRGVEYQLEEEGASIGDAVKVSPFKERFIVEDKLTKLSTLSLTESVLPRLGGKEGGVLKAKLIFDEENKTIDFESLDGAVAISGSGTYVDATEEGANIWGGRGHRTLFLDYEYQSGGDYFRSIDTLVYRDNDMTYETFDIKFK